MTLNIWNPFIPFCDTILWEATIVIIMVTSITNFIINMWRFRKENLK